MAKQKFHKGDLVRIIKGFGPESDYFPSDLNAIVIGSYADHFSFAKDDDTHIYSIHIKGRGPISWYQEEQLKLIAHNQIRLLNQWEAEEAADCIP